MSLRIPINKSLHHQFETVDLLLSDGSTVENLAIDQSGALLGKVVGGHDGLDESPFPFKKNDIIAYRVCAGIAARLGLSKWNYIVSKDDPADRA